MLYAMWMQWKKSFLDLDFGAANHFNHSLAIWQSGNGQSSRNGHYYSFAIHTIIIIIYYLNLI